MAAFLLERLPGLAKHIVLGRHVIFDEIDCLKQVFGVLIHMLIVYHACLAHARRKQKVWKGNGYRCARKSTRREQRYLGALPY
jgi:hypothetical protein